MKILDYLERIKRRLGSSGTDLPVNCGTLKILNIHQNIIYSIVFLNCSFFLMVSPKSGLYN